MASAAMDAPGSPGHKELEFLLGRGLLRLEAWWQVPFLRIVLVKNAVLVTW